MGMIDSLADKAGPLAGMVADFAEKYWLYIIGGAILGLLCLVTNR